MHIDQLVEALDDPAIAAQQMADWRLRDLRLAHANLIAIADSGVTLDLMSDLVSKLDELLPATSDPDRVLNNLVRFFQASRSPIALGSLFERDADALPTLLQLFSSSQYLSDLLVMDPAGFDLLRLTEGSPVARDALVEELCSEVASLQDDSAIMDSLRRFKRREMLRVSYGDFIRGQDLSRVTEQLSYVADAICEAALRAARRPLVEKHGLPRDEQGREIPLVILALGKLGGLELNYSSDIDLMLLFAANGRTEGPKSIDNQEFFDRWARKILKLLTENTELGTTYRVDLRLRPLGSSGPMVMDLAAAMHYYDVMGRTWERQAFVKARPIAGDLEFGKRFLAKLEPWIYRRYLTRADITGIKALKRRIEKRARTEQGDRRNVKTGHGGIRDIEFVIQFLQLLNGAELPSLRTGNTLEAILQLEQVGCLTMQERTLLEEHYRFLRKVEHNLQIMYDMQTHTLPAEEDEQRKVALRLGYMPTGSVDPRDGMLDDLHQRAEINRKILDHLLHDAFAEEEEAAPEVDLVLDPHPSPEAQEQVLGKYGFQDVDDAYQHLMALAREPIPFLSTRRCRHFLASIAPQLLHAIARTPNPDATLVELNRVSDSLGGKTVLWELFNSHPPSLQLYVRLCAASPYLSGILTSNPGMIDELMDSMILDKLPKLESLRMTLQDLVRGAEDIDLILHSFKHAQHLRVGVRDILGKEDIQATTAALADIAEVCLHEIVEREYERLVKKYGEPTYEGEGGSVHRSELVVVAMGKLGGREPNYHSDLDIVFVYSHEGITRHQHRRKTNTTSNQHFFGELGQRIIKVVNHLGPHGRLYELDLRLRPTGRSGSLAVSRAKLERYFHDGDGQLWERQALCRARAIYGIGPARKAVMQTVRECIQSAPWSANDAASIRAMRYRLQETASKQNIKRGPGGTVDVEFLVQMLQLQYGARHPEILEPGTINALESIQKAGLITDSDGAQLCAGYRFLRGIEARLRLMNTTARHDFPTDEASIQKLAYLLSQREPSVLASSCQAHMQTNRQIFERLTQVAIGDG